MDDAVPPSAVRRAGVEDIPGLLRVINAAYHVEAFFLHGERTNAVDLQIRMSVPTACFLVIDEPEQQRLAGAVYVDIRDDHGYMGMLSVEPLRQGQGLGRVLVDAVEAHCRAAGCRVLDIDVVNLRAELPAFYDRLGFVVTGEAPFPRPEHLSQPAHLILMSKPL